jgi:hypothetical protein
MAQSDESRRVLNDDAPEAIKLALRLALRGGRQQRRRCLGCGRVGIHVKVWSPHETWRVEAQGRAGVRIYWLCERCHRAGMTPELEAKLQR